MIAVCNEVSVIVVCPAASIGCIVGDPSSRRAGKDAMEPGFCRPGDRHEQTASRAHVRRLSRQMLPLSTRYRRRPVRRYII